MEVLKFKKLNETAVAPSKAHATDAGFDLTANNLEFKNGKLVYGFGIALEIPEGYVGLLFPRSSVYKSDLRLSNSIGVIDAGYRGEVKAVFDVEATARVAIEKLKSEDLKFDLNSDEAVEKVNLKNYKIGERIAQLVLMPIPNFVLQEVDELADSERGVGGYGSSGK